jgi:hypothetical protein
MVRESQFPSVVTFLFAKPSQYWSQPLSVPVSTQEITAKQQKRKRGKGKKGII